MCGVLVMMRFAALLAAATMLSGPAAAATVLGGVNNLVVLVEGNGSNTGTYKDNQAAPITLFSYTHTGTSSATLSGKLTLPQAASGQNHAISGEYGSSSEGGLQLTGDRKHLVLMGYGVEADTFNLNPTGFGSMDASKPGALAQSTSALVPRVVAVVGTGGSVDTTTALTNVFDTNNPRSVASVDGTSFYVSGQGTGADHTGGVFYAQKGATTATAITGDDTATVKNGPRNISQDTRIVSIVDGQLYVSTDSKGGKDNARSFIGTLGTVGNLPTSVVNGGAGPTMLPGFGNSGGTGKVTLTAQTGNGVTPVGDEINLSPESFFFANSTTLYVADAGQPKNDSAANNPLGDGGLQKWTFDGKKWVFDYTLSDGILGLVSSTHVDPSTGLPSGTSGLFGLTGKVVGGEVELFATNYTLGDTDQTYLYGITDNLAAKSRPSGETFQVLATAGPDTKFRGVSFAPTPEPATWALMALGAGVMGGAMRRSRRRAAAA